MPDARRVVLVADDDPDATAYVSSILEDDFRVVALADGENVLQEATRLTPALVILDVQMPRKDGFAALYDLRQDPATKAIPVIMLTGIGETTGVRFTADKVQAYMGERPDAYLEKPIDAARLAETARQLTGG